MNIIEKYDKQFAYMGVLINSIMAYQFYLLWTNPSIEDVNKIYSVAVLMGFEFIMTHSGVFMSVFPKKLSLYIFFPFYGLFALAFNSMVEGNTILYLYLIVVFNRMRFAFSNVNKVLKTKAILMSIFAAITYFVMIFIFTFNAENISVLGLTEEYITMSGYNKTKKIGGIFTDMPHVAISFSVFYYIALALIELFLLKVFSYKKITKSINNLSS